MRADDKSTFVAKCRLVAKAVIIILNLQNSFAPTRHKLRKAIKKMYSVLDDLKVKVHPKKLFIGTTRRGFDFLGYWLEPHKPLKPSQVSLSRLIERSRQLQERTVCIIRLRQYIQRWLQWHHGGLRGWTVTTSNFQWIWRYVSRFPLGKLPLDISIKLGNTQVYLPIGSCILLSIVLTILLRFLR